MNFNAKLRLIGFYNKPNQDMMPEDCFVKEAETMAALLYTSFSSLLDNKDTDSFFREILTGNTVFILKNEDNWLFAYYPKKQIARISNVIFNKKHINSIPLKYKSWFVPGCPIVVKTPDKYKVLTKGKDFFISYNGKELPLQWDSGYISVKDLLMLLECKYTELSEFCTEDDCVYCDGYDYSYCDKDRCRKEYDSDLGACVGCGGRRYKCTEERCFNKRYDNAFYIKLNQSEVDSLESKIKEIICILSTPHFQNIESVQSKNKPIIDEFVYARNFLNAYGWEFDVWNDYTKYKKLQECRDSVGQNNWISVVVDNYNLFYKVCVDYIKVKESGLFFIDYYLQTVDKDTSEYGETYDAVSDSFVEFHFPLCFSSKEERRLFLDSMLHKVVSMITLVKNKNNEFLVENFEIKK